MRVLAFVQERFPDMSSDDVESKFIKAGDSETKEGLKIEEARSQQQQWVSAGLPWPFRKKATEAGELSHAGPWGLRKQVTEAKGGA